jgi:acyl-CoA synthetase (NDP forming)
VAKDVFAATTKPFCVISNLPATIAKDEVGILRNAGIPVLEGTMTGLRALKHLLDDRTPREPRPRAHPGRAAEAWRNQLSSGGVDELTAFRLLAEYGVPVVDAKRAASLETAVAVAEEIGYPVALKTAAPGVLHKTEANGVRLGLADALAVRDAYRDVAGRLGPETIVTAMAPPGVEVALGVVRDPTFGPLVLVAAGGVLVELLHDRTLALPPIGEDAARRLLDGLAIRPLLDGVRGAAPCDVGALARAVSRLSVLSAELGDVIAELDVNPVIVSSAGCVAVDALVIPA